MNGINKRLFDWAIESPMIKNLGWLNNNEENLKKALGENETERFDATIKLGKLIWGNYSEYGIFPDLFLLGKMEINQDYHPDYRDHSTHVFKVYILGLFIYENNLTISKLFDDHNKFIHTWTVASFWHDMGYLFENDRYEINAEEVWKKVSQRINEQFKYSLNFLAGINLGTNALDRFYDISKIECSPLKSISDFEKDKDLFEYLRPAGIASGLANPKLSYNAIMEVYSVIRNHDAGKKKHIDHGIFSSLLLLKLWISYKDMLNGIVDFAAKEDNNKETNLIMLALSCVEKTANNIKNSDVVGIIKEAACAIALHNIKITDVKSLELFHAGINISNFKIFAKDNGIYQAQPFAYLLKLVDELQDWDRQKHVRNESGNSVLSGNDIDIVTTSENIWIWYREDEKSTDPEEGPRFTKLINSLSKIKLNGLLRGMHEFEIPYNDKIDESRRDFQSIFYSKKALELMEHIKKTHGCEKISVLLYNRKNGRFGFLHRNGVVTPVTDKKIYEIAERLYFKNDSIFSEDEASKKKMGFSLISTPVGSLGFLVLVNIREDDLSIRELSKFHNDESNLDDYGLMYGALVFKNIQRGVHQGVLSEVLYSADSENNLMMQINDYIPFGHNPCISVFLDIRGLSSLFNGDKKCEKLALKFIYQFSEIIEDASSSHYGMITCHLGGSMLITFNQVIREELDESCFRAICTMSEIRMRFNKELLPFARDLFGEKKAEKISLGMGASVGEAIFSTLGCSPCIFYTGIGKNISLAKKIENVSGRELVTIDENPSSLFKDKILISDELFSKCTREYKASIKSIGKVSIPHSSEYYTFHYIENLAPGKWCSLQRECKGCLNTINRRNNYAQ